MQELIKGSVQGFVKIIDKDTKEVLVDTHNDVLYGNISAALAYAMIGDPNYLLSYMAFGNGGAYVSSTGTIAYRPSQGGAGSYYNATAGLYNTIYVKKISNDSTASANYDSTSNAKINAPAPNYTDIVVDVTLGYSEPPTGISSSSTITQLGVDNSTFVGTVSPSTSSTFDPNTLVFNEIGLFAGSNNIFTGNFTQTVSEVNSFVDATVGSIPSKLMLTHVIFHPVQKAANRSLQIIYTLRLTMGAN